MERDPRFQRKQAMSLRSSLPLLPASFFGIALGLLGLGLAWRTAARVWNLPPVVGETVLVCRVAVWAIVAILYTAKWLIAHAHALAEFEHPVQSSFIGLAPVTSLLVALVAAPYSRALATVLFGFGASGTVAFAVYHTGRLWRGEQDSSAITPALYLPTVAGSFVIAIAASGLGWQDWARFAFGAGLFSWLAIESVLLNRLYAGPALAAALRPMLGIQLAPASVAALAYLNVGSGAPDIFAQALIGYAILQALLLLRLLPWITAEPFAPSYWAFSFGAAALAGAAARLGGRETAGAVAELAPWLFAAANLMILLLAAKTLRLLVRGKLLPAPRLVVELGRSASILVLCSAFFGGIARADTLRPHELPMRAIDHGHNIQPRGDRLKSLSYSDLTPQQADEVDRLYQEIMKNSAANRRPS